jgi:hypothetical protein
MARVNALLEDRIRRDPAQHLRIRLRFAKRPPPWLVPNAGDRTSLVRPDRRRDLERCAAYEPRTFDG